MIGHEFTHPLKIMSNKKKNIDFFLIFNPLFKKSLHFILFLANNIMLYFKKAIRMPFIKLKTIKLQNLSSTPEATNNYFSVRFIYGFSFTAGVTLTNFFYVIDFFIFAAIPILFIVYAVKWFINFLRVFWPLVILCYDNTIAFLFVNPSEDDQGGELPDSAVFITIAGLPSTRMINNDLIKVIKIVEINYYTDVGANLLEDVETYYSKSMCYQFFVLNRMMRNKAIPFPDILSMAKFPGPFECFYNLEEEGEGEKVRSIEYARIFRDENCFELNKAAFNYYLNLADRPARFESEFYIDDLVGFNPDLTFIRKKRYGELLIIYWFIVLFYGLPWLVKPKEKMKVNSRTSIFFVPYYHEFKLRLQDSRDKFLLSLLEDYLILNNPDCQSFEDFVKDFQKTVFNQGWAGIRRKNVFLEFRRYESARMYERLVRANALIYFDEALRKAFYAPIYYTAGKPCSDTDFLRNKTNFFLKKKVYSEFPQASFRSIITAYSHRFLTAPREHPLLIKAKRLVGAADVEENYFIQRYNDRLLAQQQVLNLLAQRRIKERHYRLTKYRLKKKKLFFSKSKQLPLQGVRQLPFNFYRRTFLFGNTLKNLDYQFQSWLASDRMVGSEDIFKKFENDSRLFKGIPNYFKVDLVRSRHRFYFPPRFMSVIQRNRLFLFNKLLDFQFNNSISSNFYGLINKDARSPIDLFNYALNNNRFSNTLAFSGLTYNFNSRKYRKPLRAKYLIKIWGHRYLRVQHPKWWLGRSKKLKFRDYLREYNCFPVFSFKKKLRKSVSLAKLNLFRPFFRESMYGISSDLQQNFKDFLYYDKAFKAAPIFSGVFEEDFLLGELRSIQYVNKKYITAKLKAYYKLPQFWFYTPNLLKQSEHILNHSILFDASVYYPNVNNSLIYYIGKRDFLNKKILFSKDSYIKYLQKNTQKIMRFSLLKYYKAPKGLQFEQAKFRLLKIFYRKKPVNVFFIRQNLATIEVDGQSFPFLNFFNWDYRFFLNPNTPLFLNKQNENNNFLTANDYHDFFSLPETLTSRNFKFKHRLTRMLGPVYYHAKPRRGYITRNLTRSRLFYEYSQNRLTNRAWHNPKNIFLSISRMYKNLAFRPIYRGLRWKRRYSLRQWRLLKLTKMYFMHPFLLRRLNSLYRQQTDFILYQNTLQRWGHRYGYYHYDYTGTAYEPSVNLLFLSRHLAPFLLNYPQKSSIYYLAERGVKKKTFLQKFFSYFSISKPKIYLGFRPNSLKSKSKVNKRYTKLYLSNSNWRLLAFSDYITSQANSSINNYYFLQKLKDLSFEKSIKSAKKLEDLYYGITFYNARQLIRILIPNYPMFAYWRGFAHAKFKGMVDVGTSGKVYRDFNDFVRCMNNRKPDYKDSYIGSDPSYYFMPNTHEERFPFKRPWILTRFDSPRYKNLRTPYRFKANPKAQALWRKNREFGNKEYGTPLLPIEYADTFWDAYTFYKFGYAFSLQGFKRILISPVDIRKLPEREQFHYTLRTEYLRRPYEGRNQLGQGPFVNSFFKQPDMLIFKPIPNPHDFNILFLLLNPRKMKNFGDLKISKLVHNNFFEEALVFYHFRLLQRLIDPSDELNFFQANRFFSEGSLLNSQFNKFNALKYVLNQKKLSLEFAKYQNFKNNTTYFFQLPLEQRRIYYRSLIINPFGVVNKSFFSFLKCVNVENSLNFSKENKTIHPFYAWQQFSMLYNQIGKIKKSDDLLLPNSDIPSYFFYHLFMQKQPIFLMSSYADLLRVINNYYAKSLVKLHSDFFHMRLASSKSFTNFTITADKLRPLMRYYVSFKPIFFSPKFPNFFVVDSHFENVKVLPILSFLTRHKQFDARASFKKHFFFRKLQNERLHMFKKRRFFVNSYLRYLLNPSFYLDVNKNDFYSIKKKNYDLYHFDRTGKHSKGNFSMSPPSSYLKLRYYRSFKRLKFKHRIRRFELLASRRVIEKDKFLYRLIFNYPLPPTTLPLYYRLKTFITADYRDARAGYAKINKRRLTQYRPMYFRQRLNYSFDQFVTKSHSYPHFTIIMPFAGFLFDRPLYDLQNIKVITSLFLTKNKYLAVTPLLNNIVFDDFIHYKEKIKPRRYNHLSSLAHNNMLLARFWNDELLLPGHQNLSYKYTHGLHKVLLKKKNVMRLLNNEFVLPHFGNVFYLNNKLSYTTNLKFILNNPEVRYLKNIILFDVSDPFFKKAKKIAQNKTNNLNSYEPFWRTNFYKLREFRPSDTRRFWPHDLSTTRRIFKRVTNFVIFAPTDNYSYDEKLFLELRYTKNREFFNSVKKIFKISDYDIFRGELEKLLLSNTNLSYTLRASLINLVKTLTPEKFYFNNEYFTNFTLNMLKILSRHLLGLPVSQSKKNYYNAVTSTMLMGYKNLNFAGDFRTRSSPLLGNKLIFFQTQHLLEKANVILARRLAYQQAVAYLTPILDFFIKKYGYSTENATSLATYIEKFANNLTNNPDNFVIPPLLNGVEGFLTKIFVIKFVEFYRLNFKKLQMRSLKLNFLNQKLNLNSLDLPIFWAPHNYSKLGYSYLVDRFQTPGIRAYLKKKTFILNNPYLLARPIGEVFHNFTPNRHFNLLNYLGLEKIFNKNLKKLREEAKTNFLYSSDLQNLLHGYLGNGELELAYPILNNLNFLEQEKKLLPLDQYIFDDQKFKTKLMALIRDNYYRNFVIETPSAEGFYLPRLIPINFIKTGLDNFDFLKLFNAELADLILNQHNFDFLNDLELQNFIARLHVLGSLFNSSFTNTSSNYVLFDKVSNRLNIFKYNNRPINEIFWQLRSFTRYPYKQHQLKDPFFFKFYGRYNLNPFYNRLPNFYNFHKKLDCFINNPNYIASYPYWFVDTVANQVINYLYSAHAPKNAMSTRTLALWPERFMLKYPKEFFKKIQTACYPTLFLHANAFTLEEFLIFDHKFKVLSDKKEFFKNNGNLKSSQIFEQFGDFFASLNETILPYPLMPYSNKQRQFYNKLTLKTINARDYPLFLPYFGDLSPFNSINFLPEGPLFKNLQKSLRMGGYTPYTFDELQHQILLNRGRSLNIGTPIEKISPVAYIGYSPFSSYSFLMYSPQKNNSLFPENNFKYMFQRRLFENIFLKSRYKTNYKVYDKFAKQRFFKRPYRLPFKYTDVAYRRIAFFKNHWRPCNKRLRKLLKKRAKLFYKQVYSFGPHPYHWSWIDELRAMVGLTTPRHLRKTDLRSIRHLTSHELEQIGLNYLIDYYPYLRLWYYSTEPAEYQAFADVVAKGSDLQFLHYYELPLQYLDPSELPFLAYYAFYDRDPYTLNPFWSITNSFYATGLEYFFAYFYLVGIIFILCYAYSKFYLFLRANISTFNKLSCNFKKIYLYAKSFFF